MMEPWFLIKVVQNFNSKLASCVSGSFLNLVEDFTSSILLSCFLCSLLYVCLAKLYVHYPSWITTIEFAKYWSLLADLTQAQNGRLLEFSLWG